MRWIWLAVMALALSAAPAEARPGATADEIEASLQRDGARATLYRYFACGNGSGYAVIETGTPRAVTLALKMLEVSDACYGELLLGSLATAMGRHPENVLPLVGRSDLLSKEVLCVPPMWDWEETPRPQLVAVLDGQERALQAVTDPALTAARNACLGEIARVRQTLAR